MKDFLFNNQSELFWSLITILALLLLRLVINKTVKRIGRKSNIVEARTLLITKYVSILITFLGVGAFLFIWGVNFKDVGVLFSSVFAVIGVGLFAQWSILSNVTSGVILFFSFPFKIGDRIKILDNEILDEQDEGNNLYLIEDIKAFHVLLRRENGELLTYPNNMILQKAVALGRTQKSNDGGAST